ncbi:MAG: RodZ domain-containing protein [Verrucomicrobiota bacterium]
MKVGSHLNEAIMQQVGEKLEEARKRQGITIREASDATKIRADFLVSFEQGTFDINLPEIYRRGFVKNYAQFLKLDPEKIMIEYSAVSGTSNLSRAARRENRETLGRMDFEPKSASVTKPSIRPSQKPSTVPTDSEDLTVDSHSSEPSGLNFDNSLIWKIGLLLGAGLISIAVFAFIINLVVQFSIDESDPEIAGTDSSMAAEESNSVGSGVPSPSPSNLDEFTLLAADRVFVIVKESEGDQQLLRRYLEAGEEVSLSSSGPATISYGNAEHLKVRKGGNTYQAAPGSYSMRTDQF